MTHEAFVQRYRHIAFWFLAAAVLAGSFAILLPFVPALLWATVLSTLMYPAFKRWRTRFQRTKLFGGERAGTVASICTVIATLLIVMLPLLVIGIGLFVQLGGVSSNLVGETGTPSFEKTLTQVDGMVKPFVDKVGSDFSLKKYVLENKDEIAKSIRAPLGNFARQAAFTVLSIVIALLSMFFMLRDGESMRKPALELIPLAPDRTNEILYRVGETIRAVFIGTVLVAMIQGTVMGILYAIAGVPHALLLGFATAVLGLIPLLGPPVLYFPIGLFLLAQGNTSGALIILLGGFLVVSQIDNLLRPFLIGGRVNLHPLAIFFSILGCVLLLGPIGIMAGPMLLTILLALIEVVRVWVGTQPPPTDPEPTLAD